VAEMPFFPPLSDCIGKYGQHGGNNTVKPFEVAPDVKSHQVGLTERR